MTYTRALILIVLVSVTGTQIGQLIRPVEGAIPSWSMSPNTLPAGSSVPVVLSGNILGSAINKTNYNCVGSNQTVDIWFDPTLVIVSSVCSVAANGALSGYFYISPSASVGVYHGRIQGIPSDFTVMASASATTQITVTQTIPKVVTQTQVSFSTITNTSTTVETSTSTHITEVSYTNTVYQTVKSIFVTTSNATVTNNIPVNVTTTSTIGTVTTSTAVILVQSPITSTVLLGILGIVAIMFIAWWRRVRTGGIA